MVCGASAGLGRALATQLAADQINDLVLIARNPERIQQLAQDLTAEYPAIHALAFSVDVCDRSQVDACAQELQSRIGPIDLLIHAVGQSDRGTIGGLGAQRLQDLFHANVLSSLNALQAFRPMLAKPTSVAVMIGSLAGLFAPRYLGGYAIVKHGLSALAQQSRLELADEGVHVMLACPGPIARQDTVRRYESIAQTDMPEEALQPGGGAKLKGLEPAALARDILRSAAKKKRMIIRPRSARLLLALGAVSPWLGDYLLKKSTS